MLGTLRLALSKKSDKISEYSILIESPKNLTCVMQPCTIPSSISYQYFQHRQHHPSTLTAFQGKEVGTVVFIESFGGWAGEQSAGPCR